MINQDKPRLTKLTSVAIVYPNTTCNFKCKKKHNFLFDQFMIFIIVSLLAIVFFNVTKFPLTLTLTLTFLILIFQAMDGLNR